VVKRLIVHFNTLKEKSEKLNGPFRKEIAKKWTTYFRIFLLMLVA